MYTCLIESSKSNPGRRGAGGASDAFLPKGIKGVVVLCHSQQIIPALYFALSHHVSRQTNVTTSCSKDVYRHPSRFPQAGKTEAKTNQGPLSPRTQRSTQHQRPDACVTVSAPERHPLRLNLITNLSIFVNLSVVI